jgi:hypothetical protein
MNAYLIDQLVALQVEQMRLSSFVRCAPIPLSPSKRCSPSKRTSRDFGNIEIGYTAVFAE